MSKRGWPHVDEPGAVGRRLKEARLAAGLSQRELAFPGCTAVYICRIERGDRVPSLQVLRQLARKLGVDEDYLATGQARTDEVDALLEAEVALRLDELELAEHLYTQALEQATGRLIEARALGGLGEIDLHAGRLAQAIERLERSRDLLGPGIAEYPNVVDSLARAYALDSEFESAIGLLEHVLERARARGDVSSESRFSILLANTLVDSGNPASARELLGNMLAQADGVGDPTLQARLYWSRSRLHSAAEDGEAAGRYARMALASIELTDHVADAVRAHRLLAHVELESGNASEALDLIERGQALATRAGGADAEGLFTVDKARALAQLGRDEEAVSIAVELAGATADRRPDLAGRGYAVAADVFAKLGERERALELYELAAGLVVERDHAFVRDLYAKMADLLEALGNKDEALELLKRAVSLQSPVRAPASH